MNDVELVPLLEEDIELVRTWRNSPSVAPYMYDESYISKEQQLEWFKKIVVDESSRYFIINYNKQKLGVVYITGINPILQSCYWGFYLGDSSVRGAGIGGKVEYTVLEYVFEELNLNKLRCEVFVTNNNVIKMHEKFGFRREAYYREHCIKQDAKLDVIGLSILKTEWQNLKQAMKIKVYG